MKRKYKKTKIDIDLSHLSIYRVAVFYKKMFSLLEKYQQKEKDLIDKLKKIKKRSIVFDKKQFVHAFKNKIYYILYLEDFDYYNYYVDSCKFTPTKIIRLQDGNKLFFLSEKFEEIKLLLAKCIKIISAFCKNLIIQNDKIHKFTIEGIDFYFRFGEFFSSLEMVQLAP